MVSPPTFDAYEATTHLQTPEHGIHFDTSSVVRTLNEKDGRDGVLPLGWFRTVIQSDKTDVNRWPEHSQCPLGTLFCIR